MTRINTKPGVVARARRAKARQDAAYAKTIRDKVAARDDNCRVFWQPELGYCSGVYAWAHLGEKQRFKTRGLPPAERHGTAWTCKLCTAHHRAYDDGEIRYVYLTDKGADGPMTWGSVR